MSGVEGRWNNEWRSDYTDIKYRDIEYTVVQDLGRQLWKWGFALETKAVTGQAATKADAVAEAERAIDRALAPKKLRSCRVAPPDGRALKLVIELGAVWSSVTLSPPCADRVRRASVCS